MNASITSDMPPPLNGLDPLAIPKPPGVVLLSTDLEQECVDPHYDLAQPGHLELCNNAVHVSPGVPNSSLPSPCNAPTNPLITRASHTHCVPPLPCVSTFVQTGHAYEGKASETINRRCYAMACELEKTGESLLEATRERDRMRVAFRQARIKIYPNGIAPKKGVEDAISASENVQMLQNHIERLNDQWERKLMSLKASCAVIQDEYETIISQLTNRLSGIKTKDASPHYSGSNSSENMQILQNENQTLRQRVSDLGARIDSMKDFCFSKDKEIISLPRTSKLLTLERFQSMIVLGNSSLGDSSKLSTPPLPKDSTLAFTEWNELIHACAVHRNRKDIHRELRMGDKSEDHVGLIDKMLFNDSLGNDLADSSKEKLIHAYGYTDTLVDYKTFLSDLATRCGVFTTDLEAENEKLRKHVASLMRELNAEMVALEDQGLLPEDEYEVTNIVPTASFPNKKTQRPGIKI